MNAVESNQAGFSQCQKAPTLGERKSAHMRRTFVLLRRRPKSAHIYLPSECLWDGLGVMGVRWEHE